MDTLPEQKQVLAELWSFLKTGREPFVTVGGYAGTGKTTVIGIFRALLKKLEPKARVAFAAYTGKASRVLAASLQNAGGQTENDSVSTIHGLIYSPVVTGGTITGWRRKQSLPADVIIIDEASMVDADIWQDLLAYQIPVIAVGDHGQLPPIGGQFNLMERPQLQLTQIHRQAQDNPIIAVSVMARETGTIPVRDFGKGVMKLDRYDSLTGEAVEAVLNKNMDEVMILTGYNVTRQKLNATIRAMREFLGPRPRPGDKVIALKNNWEQGIYNGMTGWVKRLLPVDQAGEVLWYDAEILMEDDNLFTGRISAGQFGQEKTLSGWLGIKPEDLGDLFDFGYALTVHKAQGSQAPEVLLFEERNYMSDEDWRRWLYTGVTRAQERLTVVGT